MFLHIHVQPRALQPLFLNISAMLHKQKVLGAWPPAIMEAGGVLLDCSCQ